MKKTLTTIIILFCTLSLFAETGYGKAKWRTEPKEIQKHTFIYKRFFSNEEYEEYKTENNIKGNFDEDYKTEYVIDKEILGEENQVFYDFILFGKYLYSVNYIVDLKKSEILKTKYKGDPIIISGLFTKDGKTEAGKDFIRMGLVQTTIRKENGDVDIIEDIKQDNGNGTLYIYDYNDDTRVYIYDNIIKDQAVVIYVPHEQDY